LAAFLYDLGTLIWLLHIDAGRAIGEVLEHFGGNAIVEFIATEEVAKVSALDEHVIDEGFGRVFGELSAIGDDARAIANA